MRANDPRLVAEQYADESRLQARKSIYVNIEGPDVVEMALAAVREASPRRVLEVGGGAGELAARMGGEVVMVDQSPRMVELARGRGVDARVGDVQELAFEDGSFDCAVAAWMLQHVADLDRGLAELARILRPGGRLVAVTNGRDHLRELGSLAGRQTFWEHGFRREAGDEVLARFFARVERRDADGWVTIDDAEAVHAYLASVGAAATQPFDVPLRVRRASSIFVAET